MKAVTSTWPLAKQRSNPNFSESEKARQHRVQPGISKKIVNSCKLLLLGCVLGFSTYAQAQTYTDTVVATPEDTVSQSIADNSSTQQPYVTGTTEYVPTTDRYGNEKSDLDQYAPGMLPQGMGGLPDSGPETIDARRLQPSEFKGAPGNNPLNSVGCQICGGGYGNPKLWDIDVGVRILHRGRSRGNTILEGYNMSTGEYRAINGKSISFDIAAGLDTSITRYLGRDARNIDYYFEMAYSGLNKWDETEKFSLGSDYSYWYGDLRYNNYVLGSNYNYMVETGTTEDGDKIYTVYNFGGTDSLPGGIPGLTGTATIYSDFVPNSSDFNPTVIGSGTDISDYGKNSSGEEYVSDSSNTSVIYGPSQVRFNVTSELHSAELNLIIAPRGSLHDRLVYQPNGRVRRECRQGWVSRMTVGMRYFNLHETASLSGSYAFYTNPEQLNGAEYSTDINNNLLGLQTGSDFIDKHCVWNWGTSWKLGPVYNWASRDDMLLSNVLAGSNRLDASTHAQKLGAFADISVWADYKFTKHWSAKVGYDFMWITSVGLATEQMSNNRDFGTNKTSLTGTVFYQGLNLGLECGW